MDFKLEETLDIIKDLAKNQGQVLLDRWSSVGALSYKNSRDFTTQVDVDVENHIKETLADHFPNHGFSGEETPKHNPDSSYQWLIDPIDGTKYYAAKAGLFSVSIGLLFHGEPILGVVYSPTSRQCFSAGLGLGAYLDDQPIERTDVDSLSKVIINVDTPNIEQLSGDERLWVEEKLVTLTRETYRVRSFGVGALSACWLATGALNAYTDLTGYIKKQDIAAGRIIMKEAGIRVEYIKPPMGPKRLLASSPLLWDALRNLLMDT
jgi:myo-inositol-1(or 4)-monophosphatase